MEDAQNIRIVHAGYAPSSRTLGTTHDGSDHDVKCIFVLRRSEYFGLRAPAKTFKRTFCASAGMAEVEISGWEARHACKLLSEGNPTVIHVLQSPVEFKTSSWVPALRATVLETLDWHKLATAWRQHAKENFRTYIVKVERPIRKKYVHVLRPLLCLAWVRNRCREIPIAAVDRQSFASSLPPAEMLRLAECVAVSSATGKADLEVIRRLVESPAELPCALPHVEELDALINRLLSDELDDTLRASPKADDAKWHVLCASMICDMSDF